ncbi:G-protein-signaling modulator 1-like [Osmerus mordax]|uniref:G-protein-signaling modulator 1-like n=1 Tax=Osmerus mordax TaxID=8014 RepID=UPI00350FD8F2
MSVRGGGSAVTVQERQELFVFREQEEWEEQSSADAHKHSPVILELKPNGRVGGSSPRTAQRSPRHAQLGSPTRGSSSRPARQSPLPEGTSSGRDSGLLWAQTEELFELIACSQSQRLDDQRASVSNFPELNLSLPSLGHRCGACSVPGPRRRLLRHAHQIPVFQDRGQRCTLPDPGGSDAGSEGHEDLSA